MKMRTTQDSLGKVEVPADAYFGAQTVRHLQNFQIGEELMPLEMIEAYALIKKACAEINKNYKDLDAKKANTIVKVCNEILNGELDGHFPVSVWQTGSGTHTNMNVNEVIANRANEILKKKIVHPIDDVNMSQSSNDTFPTAMHIASTLSVQNYLLPRLVSLKKSFDKKTQEFKKIIKIGRTHGIDAVPLSLGDEFSVYGELLSKSIKRIQIDIKDLYSITIGGTAVGSGINTKKGFAEKVAKKIAAYTKLPFQSAKNKFAEQASHEAILSMSACLEILSSSLTKIAQDIRLLNSGPRCGIGEISIPANESGSSIMPGKVNPTQAEAVLMVCAQVKGNHRSIYEANSLGELELNIGKPVMIYNLLQSIRLLADVCESFEYNCIQDIRANKKNIQKHLENSLMLITAFNKHIGYEKAAQIAKYAEEKDLTLKEAALKLKFVSEKQFDMWVKVDEMIKPTE